MDTNYPVNPLTGLGEKEREIENPLQEHIQKLVAEENKKAKEPSELERAFTRLSQTPDGQTVLNFIMRECGYHTTGLEAIGTGELSKRLLIKNESQRHLWVILRSFIPHGVRHLIEDPKPREKENNESGQSEQ